MIKAENLTKKYGEHTAADDITFEIKAGELVGLLGLNGAGKTTTLNMLTGYLASSGGKVYIDGMDISKEPLKAARHIGFLPDTPPVYNEMTVKAYLNFVYELKGVTAADKNGHIAEACALADIADVYNRVIGRLSRGYKQRVGLAAALIGDPDILIMDEPTVGLDPKQIIDIRKLIKTLAESRAVILSTHILPEVESICERVLILHQGKLAADIKLPLEKKKSLEDTFMSVIMGKTS
ncbi:MAG: ABC transporter ATP-binding protein [Oscillospiraceae bacterium]|nr:ABC transporter ATP-binding protein [Oscillospiraceae bacterium]